MKKMIHKFHGFQTNLFTLCLSVQDEIHNSSKVPIKCNQKLFNRARNKFQKHCYFLLKKIHNHHHHHRMQEKSKKSCVHLCSHKHTWNILDIYHLMLYKHYSKWLIKFKVYFVHFYESSQITKKIYVFIHVKIINYESNAHSVTISHIIFYILSYEKYLIAKW